MTSEERGQEVQAALGAGTDREAVAAIRRLTEHLDIPAGTITGLSRILREAWPGRSDADAIRAMEAQVARATARYRPLPPPPPPAPAKPMDPRYSPATGWGKAQRSIAGHDECFRRLAASETRDVRGERRPF
jgi:hypothetical protein